MDANMTALAHAKADRIERMLGDAEVGYDIPARPPTRVTASATPGAVALLTALLGLRNVPDACTVEDDGTSVWHLRGGLIVTLTLVEDDEVERAHWHVDREPPTPDPEGQPS